MHQNKSQEDEEALQEIYDILKKCGAPTIAEVQPKHTEMETSVRSTESQSGSTTPAAFFGEATLVPKADMEESSEEREPEISDSRFPIDDDASIPACSDPLRDLTDLCQRILEHKQYDLVRKRYCELSIQLNIQGKLAPAFRPVLKAGVPHNDPVYQLIHRDQQVIDLHWCHATKMNVLPDEPEHAAVFADPERFNFAGAWALSGKKWKQGYRAEQAMCLTTLQQCQLLTIRSSEIRDRQKKLDDGWRESGGKAAGMKARVKRAIGEWCERDKRILPHRRSYECLWQARELLGHGATNDQIAKLHALMTGENELDRTTVRDKLKKLDRKIASK